MLQIQIFKVGTGVPTLEKWAMFLLSTFIHLFSIITGIFNYIPSYIFCRDSVHVYNISCAFISIKILISTSNGFRKKNVTFSLLSETHLDFILTFPRGF